MPLWKDKTSLHISASELKVGDRGRGWGADIPLPPDLKSRRSSKARLREELKWEDLGMHCLSFPPRLSLYPLPNLKKKKKKIFTASNPITCILLTYSYNQGQDPGHSLLSASFR